MTTTITWDEDTNLEEWVQFYDGAGDAIGVYWTVTSDDPGVTSSWTLHSVSGLVADVSGTDADLANGTLYVNIPVLDDYTFTVTATDGGGAVVATAVIPVHAYQVDIAYDPEPYTYAQGSTVTASWNLTQSPAANVVLTDWVLRNLFLDPVATGAVADGFSHTFADQGSFSLRTNLTQGGVAGYVNHQDLTIAGPPWVASVDFTGPTAAVVGEPVTVTWNLDESASQYDYWTLRIPGGTVGDDTNGSSETYTFTPTTTGAYRFEIHYKQTGGDGRGVAYHTVTVTEGTGAHVSIPAPGELRTNRISTFIYTVSGAEVESATFELLDLGGTVLQTSTTPRLQTNFTTAGRYQLRVTAQLADGSTDSARRYVEVSAWSKTKVDVLGPATAATGTPVTFDWLVDAPSGFAFQSGSWRAEVTTGGIVRPVAEGTFTAAALGTIQHTTVISPLAGSLAFIVTPTYDVETYELGAYTTVSGPVPPRVTIYGPATATLGGAAVDLVWTVAPNSNLTVEQAYWRLTDADDNPLDGGNGFGPEVTNVPQHIDWTPDTAGTIQLAVWVEWTSGLVERVAYTFTVAEAVVVAPTEVPADGHVGDVTFSFTSLPTSATVYVQLDLDPATTPRWQAVVGAATFRDLAEGSHTLYYTATAPGLAPAEPDSVSWVQGAAGPDPRAGRVTDQLTGTFYGPDGLSEYVAQHPGDGTYWLPSDESWTIDGSVYRAYPVVQAFSIGTRLVREFPAADPYTPSMPAQFPPNLAPPTGEAAYQIEPAGAAADWDALFPEVLPTDTDPTEE